MMASDSIIDSILWDIGYMAVVILCLLLLLEGDYGDCGGSGRTEKDPQEKTYSKAPPVFSDDVILVREMYKQGNLARSWKKRRFELSFFRLRYYEEETLKGVFDLRGATITDLRTGKLGAEFSLFSPAQNSFLKLVAETENIRDEWISTITRLVADYQKNLNFVKIRNNEVGVLVDEDIKKSRRRLMCCDAAATTPLLHTSYVVSSYRNESSLAELSAPSASTSSPYAPLDVSLSRRTCTSASLEAQESEGTHKNQQQPQHRPEESVRWKEFMRPGEKIVAEAVITKNNQMGIAFLYILILTDTPRIFWVDPDEMNIKDEFEWPRDKPILYEAVNDLTIKISAKGREYKFTDERNGSQYWVCKIAFYSKRYC